MHDEAREIEVAKRDLVEGLIKGIEVLTAFNEEFPKMTTSQVAQRLGLSRSAARRYLLTLVHIGLAATDKRNFWLTPKVMNLGATYLDATRVPRTVMPFLERVTLQLQESTNFSVLDDTEVVYLCRVNAPRVNTLGIMPGTRRPAWATASGRVLLATLPDERIRALLGKVELVPFTHLTLVDAEELFQEIIRVRKQGYSLCDSQYEMELGGISVLVKNRRGAVLGALSVSVSGANISVADAALRCVPVLQSTASTLMKWL